MQARMNRIMKESLKRAFGSSNAGVPAFRAYFEADADVKEIEREYIVQMDLPGMDRDTVQVDVTYNSLTVSGERKAGTDETKDGYYRRERSYGSFSRMIPLPDDVNTEQ